MPAPGVSTTTSMRTPMLSRLSTVVALAVVAALSPAGPAWADHSADHTDRKSVV